MRWQERLHGADNKKVLQTFVNEKKNLVHVYIEDEEIVTTDGHPFYVEGVGFVPSENLETGDIVRLADGRKVPVISIELEYLEEPVYVYNFEVEDSHTYYVSELGVLVHNTGCPKDTPSEVETIAIPSKAGKGGSKLDLADYYEYKALKQQGYNASEAYGLMKQFRDGINPNDDFIFHFTTYEGGKGIYAGTTPTPSWALKHIPIGGWGLGKAPVRIPIKITPNMEIKTPILPLFKTRVIPTDFMDFN